MATETYGVEQWVEQGIAPGSDGALDRGCKCPVIDNGHGRGYFGDWRRFGFVINSACPLHGEQAGPGPTRTG